MKKRLLITSIVMMLVVAVALSTATYAWFTSNASVTATSITMYAATNEKASIGISWTDGNYGTSIDAVSPASSFKFRPTSIDSVIDTTHYGIDSASGGINKAFDTFIWSSATVKEVGGVPTFNDDVVNATNQLCYTWNDGTDQQANHTSFFLHNGSSTNTLESVNATVTVTGEAAEFIRVAFFKKDGANGFKLKGVITDNYLYTDAGTGTSVSAKKYYNLQGEEVLTGDGTTAIPANSFTREAKAASLLTAAVGVATANQAVAYSNNSGCISNVTIGTSVDLGGLDYDSQTNDNMEIKVLVWMDGTALNDDTAGNSASGKEAKVVLHFDAVRGDGYTPDTFGAAAQQPGNGGD